jgi:zinc protease
LIVGASGDVTPEEIARLVDIALAGLAPHAAGAPVAEAIFPASGATRVVRMPLMQSIVVFGLPGLKRDDPDFYAAYVMNYILGGGGFTSRLYEEVREKRGLAYTVYSYLAPLEYAGLYMGGVATRNDGVAQTLEIIRAEIAHMSETGVSAAELSAAKQYLTGAFPLRLDSGGKVAGILVQMQVESLGIDYLDRRNGYMEAVTMDDIKRVAKRLLNPDRLRVVVVGDPEGLTDS